MPTTNENEKVYRTEASYNSNATNEIYDRCIIYGVDVLSTKLPNGFDGLKNGTRRIIYCAKEIPNYKGFSSLVGSVTELHVGGESSIEKAIIRLGQDFMVGHPLIDIQGKRGKDYDPQGYGAPRYLKVSISKFGLDLFFVNVDMSTVPMTSTKDFNNKEPLNFIPRLPTTLLLGNLTIGYAYKSQVPMIDLPDVCSIVMKMAKWHEDGHVNVIPTKDISRYLVPSFPIDTLIRNRQELIKAYNDNYFKEPIIIDGTVEIGGYAIVLRSVPYGVNFSERIDDFIKLLKDSKSWLYDWIDSVHQYSSDKAKFSITVKRGKNPFEVWERIKNSLKFTMVMHPLYHYLIDGTATKLERGPVTLADLWYRERFNSLQNGLMYKQLNLQTEKMKCEALLIVCEYSEDVIDIIKSSETVKEACVRISKRFPELTLDQCHYLSDCKISTLVRSGKEEILRKLEEIKNELDKITEQMPHLHETIYKEAMWFNKKYGSTSRTTYSDEFIGYVQYDNFGIVHFTDNDDLFRILSIKWPTTVRKTIHLFNPKLSKHYYVRNKNLTLMQNTPREIWCDDVISFPDNPSRNLALVITQDSCLYIVQKDLVYLPDASVFSIGKTFYAIHRDGNISLENVDNYSLRKSANCKGARTDIIYALPNTAKEMLVFHMNDSNPNVLRIDSILHEKSYDKLITVPTGTTHILGAVTRDKSSLFINIPPTCCKSMNMNIVNIVGLENIPMNYHEVITLSQPKSIKKNITIKRSEIPALYYLNFATK